MILSLFSSLINSTRKRMAAVFGHDPLIEKLRHSFPDDTFSAEKTDHIELSIDDDSIRIFLPRVSRLHTAHVESQPCSCREMSKRSVSIVLRDESACQLIDADSKGSVAGAGSPVANRSTGTSTSYQGPVLAASSFQAESLARTQSSMEEQANPSHVTRCDGQECQRETSTKSEVESVRSSFLERLFLNNQVGLISCCSATWFSSPRLRGPFYGPITAASLLNLRDRGSKPSLCILQT